LETASWSVVVQSKLVLLYFRPNKLAIVDDVEIKFIQKNTSVFLIYKNKILVFMLRKQCKLDLAWNMFGVIDDVDKFFHKFSSNLRWSDFGSAWIP
jgi:hypothetical protein